MTKAALWKSDPELLKTEDKGIYIYTLWYKGDLIYVGTRSRFGGKKLREVLSDIKEECFISKENKKLYDYIRKSTTYDNFDKDITIDLVGICKNTGNSKTNHAEYKRKTLEYFFNNGHWTLQNDCHIMRRLIKNNLNWKRNGIIDELLRDDESTNKKKIKNKIKTMTKDELKGIEPIEVKLKKMRVDLTEGTHYKQYLIQWKGKEGLFESLTINDYQVEYKVYIGQLEGGFTDDEVKEIIDYIYDDAVYNVNFSIYE